MKRPIPTSLELLPVIGLGTYGGFDVGASPKAREPLKEVLRTLLAQGASVVDSSPMYGAAEKVTGELSIETGLNDKLFIATKVWTTGREEGIRQMNRSFDLLKRRQIDLMQIHNLVDWQTHLHTLRDWKDEGRIRYTGITHYTESAYARIESILNETPVDFLQINYSILHRRAEERLLPLAQEKGVAVLVNLPFGQGDLFRRFTNKPLPELANALGCSTWAQFFLKFILAHPAVTCIIPGTSSAAHLKDNLSAATTSLLPDEKQRQQMIQIIKGH
jgi:diketogulonate reductase-like aldo/keto reductase